MNHWPAVIKIKYHLIYKLNQIRRNFQRGNFTNITKYWGDLEWNDLLRDKSITKCGEFFEEGSWFCYYYIYSFQITERERKQNLTKATLRKERCKKFKWNIYFFKVKIIIGNIKNY